MFFADVWHAEILREPRQEFVLMRIPRATLLSRIQERIAGLMRRIGVGTHVHSPIAEISFGMNDRQLRWLFLAQWRSRACFQIRKSR
jgi:hypothetical protein